ncbi:MAG: aminotransferase class V-fold PLP-dependent enzyme [Desulfurococcaceae archaeon]
MGAADIRVDEWSLDIVFSSSQKAFGVPPGLAMAAISEEVFEKARKVSDRGWYFDLIALREDLVKGWSTPSTPPIPQVAGLNAVLRIVEKMGGKNMWLEMYEKRAEKIRSKVVELGLELFAKPGFYSPTITVVRTPMGLKSSDIYYNLRSRGFEIAMGYGPIKEATFRIGHMGYITDQDIDDLFKELSDVLRNLKPS